MIRKLRVFDLSSIVSNDYVKIWKFQKTLAETLNKNRILGKVSDYLLLVQHQSVYTFGRGATLDNIKVNPSTINDKLYRIERGGEVTWHGPGQLVAYPIFDLYNHKKDLHWYTSSLEESVIKTLNSFSITGERNKINTGIWIGNNKICAIGVSASRWITYHGLSLNVTCNLNYYNAIIPCGISNPTFGVTNMIKHNISNCLEINMVSNHLVKSIAEVFNFNECEVLSYTDSINELEMILNEDKVSNELSLAELFKS